MLWLVLSYVVHDTLLVSYVKCGIKTRIEHRAGWGYLSLSGID